MSEPLRRFTAAAALVFTLLAPCHARQDHDHAHDHAAPAAPGAPSDVAPPATPAGQRLAWVLEAMAGEAPVEVDGLFAQIVLEKISEFDLERAINSFRAQSGGFALRSVEEAGPNRLVATTQANADASWWRIIVSVEEAEPHLFNGLLFQPAPDLSMAELGSWDDAYAQLEKVGADAALGVYSVADDGALTPIYERAADRRLAIGSTFKLWIAGALAEAVEAGEFSWGQMLMIQDDLRSLPSGKMQDLAHGEERPIEEYATLMIAISDNTATDHLLNLVGRERVEAFMSRFVAEPERNLPFLSTREIFAIKLSDDPGLMERYAGADVGTRREILAQEVAGTTPNIMMAGSWTAPRAIDRIEWFATAPELCRTMSALWEMSEREGLANLRTVLGSNNGLGLKAETWPSGMFKGGSEPGVMSLTWVLERADGRRFAVSMTVNDAEHMLEEMRVVGIAQRVMERLAKEP